jgi:serine O-acetyltransferase
MIASATSDPFWRRLQAAATEAARAEPSLAQPLDAAIHQHKDLGAALAYQMGQRLGGGVLPADDLQALATAAYAAQPSLVHLAEVDVLAVEERDPACRSPLQPLLFFKGYLALQTYRVAHWLWGQGRFVLAYALQSRMSEVLQVDIHPAAQIGAGVFIDHATGVVIGETAVVGDDVSMLHGVTLGGTRAVPGDRHPKIGRGVLLGAGASVLGNITIGDHARVAASSVVLKSVPPHCTVAGIPAVLMDCPTCDEPARAMDHDL